MSEALEYDIKRVGSKLSFTVTNGQVQFADRCDPTSALSRNRLIKSLGAKFPAFDTDAIEKELLQAAGAPEPTQGKQDELGDPNEASDAALAEMPQSVRSDALRMLKSPDLIKQVCRDIADVGVVGEHGLALTVYLLGTSRLLPSPLAGIVQGGSSSGKSHSINTVAGMFPPETTIMATDMTPNALYYMERGTLRNKFVVAGERSRVEDDDRAEATRALREMLSSGVLRKVLPQKTDDGIQTIVIENPGPIAFIESTTLAEIFEEDRNRALLLASDDGHEQTRAVVRAIAIKFAGGDQGDGEGIRQRHRAAQRMLRRVNVRVPFAGVLGELIPDERPDARRVISQALTMVQSVAMLHQFQRLKDCRHGAAIDATLCDYRVARELLVAPLGRALDGRLPDHVASLAEWLVTATKQGESFTVKQLAGRDGCRWSRTTLYDLVKPLASAGVLADAGMEGRSSLYRLAGSLPGAGVTWLPMVSELEAQQ